MAEEPYSELRMELLKQQKQEKGVVAPTAMMISEAPVVNPNAALGTPPRLRSDGEHEPEGRDSERHSNDEGKDIWTGSSGISWFMEILRVLLKDFNIEMFVKIKKKKKKRN